MNTQQAKSQLEVVEIQIRSLHSQLADLQCQKRDLERAIETRGVSDMPTEADLSLNK